MRKASPEVKRVILEAVKDQIESNNPPATKQTYERLLSENITEEDAYIYLGQALISEMFVMMKEKRQYDEDNYVKLLSQLPHLFD